MTLKRLISGGQTGVDAAGLRAARDLGIETGGWAPAGWRTEIGPAPWLSGYGLKEHPSRDYPPRTRQNVEDANGVLLVGNPTSPGSRLTQRYAVACGIPIFPVAWKTGMPKVPQAVVVAFQEWLAYDEVTVLDVAGNRESTNPGIGDVVYDFLMRALRPGDAA
jgi:hypothetical protein